MRADFDLVLDRCLQKLNAGSSLEECLAECPEHAEALRPLLEIAQQAGRLPRFEVRPNPFDAGRQRMLDALSEQEDACVATLASGESGAYLPTENKKTLAISTGRFSRYAEQIQTFFDAKVAAKFAAIFARKESADMKFAFSMILSVAVVLFTLVTAVGSALAGSLPGDLLYPVKRAQEDFRLHFASAEAKQQLEESFLQERHAEVQALIGLKRSVIFEFDAIVEAMAPEQWRVGGFVLTLDAKTSLDKTLAVGKRVRARVQVLADGKLLALWLREAYGGGHPRPSKTPTEIFDFTHTPSPTPEASHTPLPSSVSLTDTPTPYDPLATFTPTPRRWTATPDDATKTATPLPTSTSPRTPTPLPSTATPGQVTKTATPLPTWTATNEITWTPLPPTQNPPTYPPKPTLLPLLPPKGP